jgi:F-type H+-transporting ATPase subunit a
MVLLMPACSDGDEGETSAEEAEIEIDHIINHHISDSHKWVIFAYTGNDGSSKEISLSLPVILVANGQWYFGLSSSFDDNAVVSHKDNHFVMYHDIIYSTDASGQIIKNSEGEVTNQRPLDLSVTKNVTALFLSASLLLILFLSVARRYKTREKPAGMQSAMEAIIMFIDKDIAQEQIGHKGSRYTPYLLTLFFFIWINNLLGLIPIFPASANLSGNIAFTAALAIFTFFITAFSGNRQYWKHIFVVPGVPPLLKVILVPIEIVSVFTKPFTLLIRLFANVTGGHIILISLISMIFIAKSFAMAPISIALSLLIFVLEIIFGLLQAYIFTLLSALYIGLAVQEDH